VRIEVASAAGCAIIGALFELGGQTLRGMAIFLFGWSFGCVFHLATMFLTRRHGSQRRRQP